MFIGSDENDIVLICWSEQQVRQIGNAVPVPLALALGKALGDSLVKMWDEKKKEGKEGSPDL